MYWAYKRICRRLAPQVIAPDTLHANTARQKRPNSRHMRALAAGVRRSHSSPSTALPAATQPYNVTCGTRTRPTGYSFAQKTAEQHCTGTATHTHHDGGPRDQRTLALMLVQGERRVAGAVPVNHRGQVAAEQTLKRRKAVSLFTGGGGGLRGREALIRQRLQHATPPSPHTIMPKTHKL